MEALFTEAYMPLWAMALALALFFPVRQLIWVLYVRRAQGKAAQDGREIDDEERARLRRRAGFTSALLCFVFAFVYTANLFQDAP